MTGTTLSSASLDARRRRILIRAWRRGTREMDLLLGRFADAHLAGMSETEVEAFEALIELPDADLFDWIAGNRPVPGQHLSPVFESLRAYSLGGAPDRQ